MIFSYILAFTFGVIVGVVIQHIIHSRKKEIFICDYWGEMSLKRNGSDIGKHRVLFKIFYDLKMKEYSVKSPIVDKVGGRIGGLDLPEYRVSSLKTCMESDGIDWKSFLDEILGKKLGSKN